ncbi:hypothetical protein Tco_0009435 [Tanacetum coccineum]
MEEEPSVNDVINDDDHSQDDTAPRPEQDWHHLKKDKITKVDLEGLVFKLFKGTCRSSIELEYHLEQRYLAFYDQLDWANPKGDIIPKDFSKPLPLLGAPSRLYIPVEFFFNKDLEYLRSRNLEEKKYTASFTKAKASRYELYSIEEMIPNL